MRTSVKTCFKCGETKSLEGFYRHSMMGDGRLGKCKECTKKDVRDNRLTKIDQYRAYDRDRGVRTNPDTVKKRKAERPWLDKARTAVGNAVRDGKLKKPSSCEKCGSTSRLHGHHEDYDKPLEVMWLCVVCHKARHKELGWGYVWNAGFDRAG